MSDDNYDHNLSGGQSLFYYVFIIDEANRELLRERERERGGGERERERK